MEAAALLAEEHRVAFLDRDALRAAHDVREELVGEVGNDEPDGVRTAADEAAGDDVGLVAELFCGVDHARAGVGGDARGWVARQHQRHGRLGDAGSRRDVVGGYAPLCGG